MRALICLIWTGVLLAHAALAQEPSEPRHALVVGNADYAIGNLRNPLNDARSMAAVLLETGFKVTVVENAGNEAFDQAVEQFAAGLTEGSVALFYYAGHAVQRDGRNYLLPVDTKAGKADAVIAQGINTSDIIDRIHARGVGDALAFFRPDALVFDGNVPYGGLLAAFERHPWVKRIWVRRALWSPVNDSHAATQRRFDMVIEPGELSARFDRGPTSGATGVSHVAPILAVEPDERLPADAARDALGLPREGVVVALMLGAGTNFDLREIRARLIDRLAARPDVTVVELLPPIRGTTEPAPPQVRQLEEYPAFRFSRAFDAMIAGAGYNTFHENMLGAIPTLFVPNEAEEMDLQILRAWHATSIGCARMLRADDAIGLDAELAALLDPDVRARMVDRMARLSQATGAADAARLIHEMCHALRTADVARLS